MTGVTFCVPTTNTTQNNFNGTQGMIFDDVDGDGDQDMFEYNAPRWWVNDGAGNLAPAADLSPSDPVFVAAKGDMDGDGRQDIAFAHSNFRQRGWFRNDGTGTAPFTVASVLYRRPLAVWDVETLDADGDGDAEIVVLGAGLNEIELYDNVAGKAMSRVSSPVGDQVYSAVSGDLNGDGLDDLVTNGFQSIRPWLGSSSGVFLPTPQLMGTVESYAYAAKPADIDGDGILDLVTSTDGGSIFSQCSVQWRAGAGDGTFGPPALVTPTFIGALNEVRTADVDGDGLPDVMGRTWGRELRAWRNLGGGAFEPMSLVLASANVDEYALGDLDGDGDLDVVVSGRPVGPGVIEIYETTPTGPSGPTATAPLLAESGIEIGDVGGDGTPDVVLQVRPPGGFSSQRIVVALAVGPGLTLAPPLTMTAPLDDELVRSATDWEGDGDLDIAWGNPDLMTVGLLLDPRLGEFGDGYCDAQPNSTGERGGLALK